MLEKTKRNAVFLLAMLAILLGGGLLSACAGSGAVSAPESVGMLYFYAKW